MFDALYISESGLSSQQKLIDVISNNIANMSTVGFKKSNVNFVDIVVQSEQVNTQNSTDLINEANKTIQGIGVSVGSVNVDHSAGTIKQTGNPLDLAVNGIGFFEVLQDDGGLAYSRSGRFQVDADGFIATPDGLKLNSDIRIPPDTEQLSITADGVVSVLVPGEDGLVELGEIELVRFNSPSQLQAIGEGVYQATDASGDPTYGQPGELGLGDLIQGATEMSNVSMNEEMVNLMMAQRGYQLNARILQVSDQMMETINNLRR
ncbi:flagellar basal-body rod protein FlgG [Catenovulum sp. SM1970]|uniref:flagellar basal-body rod protein FlgG n=1 Tax=Marinifaba aquimaris TaxID=2741323 RepID=UPI0015725EB4|nr:flagellar basal-body rod protein FlgG [Marinifaba aquimaris]NTS77393.1 flagellar basal-body rod protein FlgG [Marinifaba aquimaris]